MSPEKEESNENIGHMGSTEPMHHKGSVLGGQYSASGDLGAAGRGIEAKTVSYSTGPSYR